MSETSPIDDKRCLFGPDDVDHMRRKFDEVCDKLGVFCEDDKARQAVGRAVVKSFESGLVDPAEKPPA